MATSRGWLGSLGDDEYDNKYLLIFTGLSALSIVGLPFLDPIIGRYGWHVAFQSINLLSLAHGIVQLSSENLNVQILGFCIFSFYRCFHFSVTFSYLPVFLGGTAVGRGAGSLNFFSSFFSLTNIGLVYLAVETFNGNYFVTNLIMTLCVVPCVVIAWWMGVGMKKEEEAELFDDDTGDITPIRLSSRAIVEVKSRELNRNSISIDSIAVVLSSRDFDISQHIISTRNIDGSGVGKRVHIRSDAGKLVRWGTGPEYS
jgi:hypothetical protein